MLEKIRHVNFINIMALCTAETDFHIVMELFEGKSLDKILFNEENEHDYFLTQPKKTALDCN